MNFVDREKLILLVTFRGRSFFRLDNTRFSHRFHAGLRCIAPNGAFDRRESAFYAKTRRAAAENSKDAGLKPGATLKAKTTIRTHPWKRRVGHPQKRRNCRSLGSSARPDSLGMTTIKKSTGKSACATEAAWKAALEKLPRVPHERNRTLETEGCGTRAKSSGAQSVRSAKPSGAHESRLGSGERRPRDDSDSGGIPRSGSTLLTGESSSCW
jgi:hypothetical protein